MVKYSKIFRTFIPKFGETWFPILDCIFFNWVGTRKQPAGGVVEGSVVFPHWPEVSLPECYTFKTSSHLSPLFRLRHLSNGQKTRHVWIT